MTDLSFRLSSHEAEAPKAVDPILKARQHKLRKIVFWVVGGAALLACAGLVRVATRSHSETTGLDANVAVAQAASPVAPSPPAQVAEPVVAAPAEPVVAAPAAVTPEPKAVSAHVAKAPAKTAKHATPAKSPVLARHF